MFIARKSSVLCSTNYSSAIVCRQLLTPKIAVGDKKFRRMILGGTGQMGSLLRSHFTQLGDAVVATSRTGQPEKEVPLVDVKWEKTPKTTCEKIWKDIFKRQLATLGPNEHLFVVNTIGAPYASKGQTLDDVNVVPAAAAMTGLMEAAEELRVADRIHFTHVSSIVAGEIDGRPRLPGDAYALSKTKGEKVVKDIGKNKVSIFRMGYGLDRPLISERKIMINNHHGWSPDQIATLPIVPIVGNGKQPLQPVSMEDALIGIANAPLYREIPLIEGVGPKVVTQEEFYRFFRKDLLNASFRPVYLSPKQLQVVAEHFPHGHFAPYAVRYLANGGYVIDHTPLETVVGRSLLSLQDIYVLEDGKTYVMTRPPIARHVKEAAKKAVTNPRSAWEVAKTIPRLLDRNVKGDS